MTVDFGRPLSAAIGRFGRDVVYAPRLGDPVTIQGILDTGVQPEGEAPGVYALLSIADSVVSPLPEAGEEITVDSSIYKIVRREIDAGKLVRLLLRFHREVGWR